MTTQLIGQVFAAFRRWRHRRAAIQELDALTDRLLRDIGIERRDIHRAVDALISAQDHARSWRPHVHEVLPPVESRGRPRAVEASERGRRDAA